MKEALSDESLTLPFKEELCRSKSNFPMFFAPFLGFGGVRRPPQGPPKMAILGFLAIFPCKSRRKNGHFCYFAGGGSIFGPFWALLGPLWTPFGAFGTPFGALWAPLGPLGPLLGPFGPL